VPNFASAGISIFNTAILELTGSKSAPVLEEKTEEEQKTNQALHQWMISSMSMGACNKYKIGRTFLLTFLPSLRDFGIIADVCLSVL